MAHVNRIPDLNKGNPLHKKAVHIGKAATTPDSPGGNAASRTKEPRIDIKLYQSKSGNYAPVGDFFLIVTFYSHMKPNFALQAPVVLQRKSDSELDFEVGVLCGAMAERLGEVYGDNFDPDFAARHGADQMRRVVAAWQKQP